MKGITTTTIDSSGRLVIPKAIRDRAGFRAGQVLEVTCRDGRVEIEVAPVAIRIEERGRVAVAVREESLPTLRDEEVERTIEDLRAQRSGDCQHVPRRGSSAVRVPADRVGERSDEAADRRGAK